MASTADSGENHHNPIWSPDGTEVVFTATRPETNGGELYVRRADGSDTTRHVGGRPEHTDDFATQWLEDGTVLFDGQTTPDIYMTSTREGGTTEALLEADWVEMGPKVSPDGRWLAYMSNEDGGVSHLFVRRWPDLGGKVQLTSGNAGISVGDNGLVWAADSRTLYFLRGRRLIATGRAAARAYDARRRHRCGRRRSGSPAGRGRELDPGAGGTSGRTKRSLGRCLRTARLLVGWNLRRAPAVLQDDPTRNPSMPCARP